MLSCKSQGHHVCTLDWVWLCSSGIAKELLVPERAPAVEP